MAKEIRYHQECYDGRGYPEGLKGNGIPLIARIIAVCDAFDAITTDRPYRKRKTVEEAIKDIQAGSGTQFDPIVVSAFLLAFKKGKLGHSYQGKNEYGINARSAKNKRDGRNGKK